MAGFDERILNGMGVLSAIVDTGISLVRVTCSTCPNWVSAAP